MGKHTLEIEYDFDFLLIGISTHEKDYRLCWSINNVLGIELTKQDSLEIKGKKQTTPSYFSFYLFEKPDEFVEYSVIANLSESKENVNTLFDENEFLIPEQKAMNYFFIIKAELDDDEINRIMAKLKEINTIQAALRIDVKALKSKQNLIF